MEAAAAFIFKTLVLRAMAGFLLMLASGTAATAATPSTAAVHNDHGFVEPFQSEWPADPWVTYGTPFEGLGTALRSTSDPFFSSYAVVDLGRAPLLFGGVVELTTSARAGRYGSVAALILSPDSVEAYDLPRGLHVTLDTRVLLIGTVTDGELENHWGIEVDIAEDAPVTFSLWYDGGDRLFVQVDGRVISIRDSRIGENIGRYATFEGWGDGPVTWHSTYGVAR